MELFIPSFYKPGKKNSPKWFNSQCAKAVMTRSQRFKQWKFLQTLQSRALFVQARNLCSNTINRAKTSFINRVNHKIASCQTGSRSFWSLAEVVSQNFCYSSFPPLKHYSGSSSCTPSSNTNFLHPSLLPIPILMMKNPSLLSTQHPLSQCHLLRSLHASVKNPSPAQHL